MKTILSILLLSLLISCKKEAAKTTSGIEGNYRDTSSFFTPAGAPFAYIDSIATKTVYKINDSTYWMQAFWCNDTTGASCMLGGGPITKRFGFIIQPNNNIRVIQIQMDPIFYPPPSGGYYDPGTQYLYLTRVYSSPDTRVEVHRMRKF